MKFNQLRVCVVDLFVKYAITRKRQSLLRPVRMDAYLGPCHYPQIMRMRIYAHDDHYNIIARFFGDKKKKQSRIGYKCSKSFVQHHEYIFVVVNFFLFFYTKPKETVVSLIYIIIIIYYRRRHYRPGSRVVFRKH